LTFFTVFAINSWASWHFLVMIMVNLEGSIAGQAVFGGEVLGLMIWLSWFYTMPS